MLAKKTSKNQITLPKEAAGRFPGVDYFEVSVEDSKIILLPIKLTPLGGTVERVRKKMAELGLTENDVAEAVKWARRK
jgi:hypothetical protein